MRAAMWIVLACLLATCAGAFPAAWEARVEQGSMLATDVPQNFVQFDPQNLPIVANGYVGTLIASSRPPPQRLRLDTH